MKTFIIDKEKQELVFERFDALAKIDNIIFDKRE